uniref:Uncharacterized protein n=1 Tax=Anguilla anguilla TaxID=7936 RepID=A0A0E9UXH8_ANGAN
MHTVLSKVNPQNLATCHWKLPSSASESNLIWTYTHKESLV